MPALHLMPFGVRCAPWGEWLQGPESPCGTSAQRCSPQAMSIRAHRGRVRAMWKLKLNSNTHTSGASVAISFGGMPTASGPTADAFASRDAAQLRTKRFYLVHDRSTHKTSRLS